MMEWQPIETAPRNGEDDILLCDGRTGICIVAFWNPDPDIPGDSNHWETLDGPTYPDGWPTHWMPLPDPPKTEA